MRFFFDRNMPPQLARMVDALEREHTARSYYDDRFAELTPDVEWIKILAEDDPSWIIISGDGIDIKPRGIVVEKKGEDSTYNPTFIFHPILRLEKFVTGKTREQRLSSTRRIWRSSRLRTIQQYLTLTLL